VPQQAHAGRAGAAPHTIQDALHLDWVLGFQAARSSALHDLGSDQQRRVLFTAAHTAVIYDYEHNTQQLLQGHRHELVSCAVSADRRWIATGDAGPDSMVIVWDARSGLPVRSLFSPHGSGVAAVALSAVGSHLVTVSAERSPASSLAIWNWSAESGDRPICEFSVPDASQPSALGTEAESGTTESRAGNAKALHTAVFHPTEHRLVCATGENVVVFADWTACEQNEAALKEAAASGLLNPPALGTAQVVALARPSATEFNRKVGAFVASAFVPGTDQALTVSSDGAVIVWAGPGAHKHIEKVVTLQKTAVTGFATHGHVFATGDVDGSVRVFSYDLHMLFWFESLRMGAVQSISFSNRAKLPLTQSVVLPDFLVATSDGCMVAAESSPPPVRTAGAGSTLSSSSKPSAALEDNGKLLRVILRGHSGGIHAVAGHPTRPWVAVAGHSGLVQLFDLERHEMIASRVLGTSGQYLACSLAFSPQGDCLAVGCVNGTIVLLEGLSLTDLSPRNVYRRTGSRIVHLTFSADGQHIAAADDSFCVLLLRYDAGSVPQNPLLLAAELTYPWVFVGKCRSHFQAITGLCFAREPTGRTRLFSCGQDCRLVEYDVDASSVSSGVRVKGEDRFEHFGRPSCMSPMVMPKSGEVLILTGNDRGKLRMYNPSTHMVRQTVRAPMTAGVVQKMERLSNNGIECMLFALRERVVGLMLLPMTGNPHESMAVIGHPGDVAGVAVCGGGSFVVSCGGHDGSALVWQVDARVLQTYAQLGGDGMTPFLDLLDGGRDGEQYRDMVDLLYLAQIQDQGEESMERRRVSDRLHVSLVPDVFRGLGYYPSEQEIQGVRQHDDDDDDDDEGSDINE
jgi:cilia- and flagella-associated protein 251